MPTDKNTGWTVAGWLFGALQAISLVVMLDIRASLAKQADTLNDHSTALAVITARHNIEDRTKQTP